MGDPGLRGGDSRRHRGITGQSPVPVPIPSLRFAVSNEVPEHPCVSPVSNHVYERRLIEKYIAENGTDPVNNQPLSEEQLIDIKGAGIGMGNGNGAPRGEKRLSRGREWRCPGCFGVCRGGGEVPSCAVGAGEGRDKGGAGARGSRGIQRPRMMCPPFFQSRTRSAPNPPRPPASRPS